MAETDPLSKPARRPALEALRAAAVRALLFLGTTLLLAGVVFFFAWNWAAMGAGLKFGLVGTGLVACLVAAGVLGLDRLVGQVLLLAAAMLVGVFLAVHGQVYQTGADAYQLFLGWAVLILGWTVLSRFAVLWILWLVVLNTAVFLYWEQVMAPDVHGFPHAPWVLLGLAHGVALAGREFGHHAGRAWLAAPWLRWVLLTALLAWLVIPAADLILEHEKAGAWGWTAVPLWLAAMAATGWYYRFRVPDLPSLTLWAASACAVGLTLAGRLLAEVVDDEALLLLLGLIVIAVVGTAVLWLRRTGAALEGESDDR